MATGKLVVLAAFTKTDDGQVVPAFEPRQVDTQERAVREERLMASQFAGVMAWSRDADPVLGERPAHDPVSGWRAAGDAIAQCRNVR